MSDGAATMESPWGVGVLGDKLKGWIDRLGQVWVEGEITQWGVRGANVYGKLKDLERDVTVSFQIWSSVKSRLPADLKQGDRVVALVKPDYWVKGGSLSMQVFQMKHVGLGDLLERLELLRRTLAAEGLFDRSRKRRLPFLPNRIGLITGKDSDAEKDVIRNAQLRWPSVDFRVVHAAVQGDRTVPEVLAALATLEADPEVDVIVIARGGGDFQNLLGFSDERLLRAVAAATTPVVSAIGHDNDRPLLDEVADLRASTPTDAAKRVVPDVTEELNGVSQARARIRNRLTQLVRQEADRIAGLRARRVLADGSWIIESRADELTRWAARSAELIDRFVDLEQRRLAESRGHLRALSPLRTLERGYAIVLGGDGTALRRTADAPAGTQLTVRVVDGAVAATSEGVVHSDAALADTVGARS
ncbi:exodeoxyribonuclease VII large subunit [Amnibacterium kyonggiense]|uniref:Exodeoxyribonuclease 7 large subunit n=1 Tax=Amnibacterium kyonggiense TaxID=595671 RepID=A0A4R7FGE0_9MICO|nr:exodeoxyribonuclease VII large subunit [Amnibacterium kyonggiense]TDS76020.1 exodeoxyribonuclease VII large subunit [Amnibacterium kyonggiense]